MLINFLKYSILSLVLSSNPSEMNIVETAVSNDYFSTLVAAVQAGELVDALSSEGPFTVFAPTNDGFNKFPEGTLHFIKTWKHRDFKIYFKISRSSR